MKRTKRVLGLALAAVMCMGMLAGCGGTKNATIRILREHIR